MSYSSRVYRQRNPKSQEDAKGETFFTKQKKEQTKAKKANFFQAKPVESKQGDSLEKEADSIANAVVNNGTGKSIIQNKEITAIQRLATTAEEEVVSSNDKRMERDKEKPYQKKSEIAEKDKTVQKKEGTEKDREKSIQKKDEPSVESEKMVIEKNDSKKEKDSMLQKKAVDSKEKEKRAV